MDAAEAAESEGGGGVGFDLSEEDGTITTTQPILDTIHQQQLQAYKIVSTKQHLSGKGNHVSNSFMMSLVTCSMLQETRSGNVLSFLNVRMMIVTKGYCEGT